MVPPLGPAGSGITATRLDFTIAPAGVELATTMAPPRVRAPMTPPTNRFFIAEPLLCIVRGKAGLNCGHSPVHQVSSDTLVHSRSSRGVPAPLRPSCVPPAARQAHHTHACRHNRAEVEG